METCFGLYKWAEIQPNKLAIDDGRVRLSYKELTNMADALAAGLYSRGVRKGDSVLVSTPNFAEYLIIMFACLKLGAVQVCGNMQFKDRELNYLGKLIGQPKIAFMHRNVQSEIMASLFPTLEIVTIAEDDEPLAAIKAVSGESETEIEDVFNERNDMLLVFTSGSTGVPKAVCLTVANMYTPMLDMIERFDADEKEVLFIPVPFCQTAGMCGILIALIAGGSIITNTRFDGQQALELIEKHRITLQFCVTTIYAREIEAYENASVKPDISSLRTGTIGGGPVVKDYMRWFEEKCGCRLLNFYGLTECAGMICANYHDPQDIRINRLGKPCRHVTVTIRDDNNEEVPDGVEGEICCKSPGVTSGYFGNSEQTRTLLDENGWMHSGDIGMRDSDGYITLTGRKKEMIIRGGYNVFPAEIENLLLSRGDVLLAAMVPFAGGDLGEKIAVFVQMKEGCSATEEELRTYTAAHVAKFKVPDRIIFLDNMPMLPSSKVDKVKLKSVVQDYV